MSDAILFRMNFQFIQCVSSRLALIRQVFANAQPQTVGYDWFSEQEVASYDRAMASNAKERIDDGTWRDLYAPAHLRLIGANASIVGRQMLYHLLRVGRTKSAAHVNPLSALAHPDTNATLEATQSTRHCLRCIDAEITGTIFHNTLIEPPAWSSRLRLTPYILACAAISASQLHAGAFSFGLVLAYLAFNAWVQIRLHPQLIHWRQQRDGVLTVLQAALSFGTAGMQTPHPCLQELADQIPETRRLITLLSPTWVERTPILFEYANLLALHEYAWFGQRMQRVRIHVAALQTVYENVARCEAQLCLMEHLQERSGVCHAEAAEAMHMRLTDMVNPLVRDAEPLSLVVQDKGVFISGKNGVGKSTFLRGLGLNLLAGRAFGFCYATEAAIPAQPVWSSIQNEDSLLTGDSLYMAEMRRCETLLKVAESSTDAVFILDEIFRGTNHAESLSVAASVIQHLAKHGLVIVSSHHVMLAALLESQLNAVRIVRSQDGDGHLSIEPGVLTETNGIVMMQRYAIPEVVQANARRVYDWITQQTSGHDRHPELLLN